MSFPGISQQLMAELKGSLGDSFIQRFARRAPGTYTIAPRNMAESDGTEVQAGSGGVNTQTSSYARLLP